MDNRPSTIPQGQPSAGGRASARALWPAVRSRAARSQRLRRAVALARAVRHTGGALELTRYAQDHSSTEDPLLLAVGAQTRALSEDDYMMAGPVTGHLLAMLVHAIRPRRVLEIGTFTGYSALAMARALPADGHIVSCEIDPLHAQIARRHVAASRYEQQITIEVGPALATIATLPGPFDLVFIDADKTGYLDYYQAVLPKLSPHGLIAVDNTLHMGLVAPDSGYVEPVAAVRRFNSAVADDPRVEQVVLDIGDGLTLIRRVDAPPDTSD